MTINYKQIEVLSNNSCMNQERVELIRRMGNKCAKCGETDLKVLHVDHKFGQGYIENEIFGNTDNMYSYYLRYFNDESPFLQVLCMNCNIKKRIENKETAGRDSFQKLASYFSEPLLGGDIETTRKRLEDFPQFIPIMLRFARTGKNLIDVYSDYGWKESESNVPLSKLSEEILKKNTQKNPSAELPLLRDEIFRKTMIDLEGSEKKPVPFRLLLKTLMQTGKFTEYSGQDMIWSMENAHHIISKQDGYYNIPTQEEQQKIMEEERKENEKRQLQTFRFQLLLDMMKSLEGDEKKPVDVTMLIKELVKTGKFTEEEVRIYIKNLQRESVIYESKSGYYNRV